jgi:hypothetical protein
MAAAEAAVERATDHAFAKRVLRKIDQRLIPLLFLTYMLNFMDKTILSSASVFGLSEDTVGDHSSKINLSVTDSDYA